MRWRVTAQCSQGGVAGYFMGHTSEEILQRTRCSVFTVKPESFITPVSPKIEPAVADALPVDTAEDPGVRDAVMV